MESPEGRRRNQTQGKPWRTPASLAAACSAHQRGAGQGMDTLPASESSWLRDPSGPTKVSGRCENASVCLSRENFDFGSGLSRERAGLRGRRMDPSLTVDWHPALCAGGAGGAPPVPWPCRGTWLCPGLWRRLDPLPDLGRLAHTLHRAPLAAALAALCRVMPCRSPSPQHPFLMFVLSFMLSTCVPLSSH